MKDPAVHGGAKELLAIRVLGGVASHRPRVVRRRGGGGGGGSGGSLGGGRHGVPLVLVLLLPQQGTVSNAKHPIDRIVLALVRSGNIINLFFLT